MDAMDVDVLLPSQQPLPPQRKRPVFGFWHSAVRNAYCFEVYRDDYYPFEALYDMLTCGGQVEPQQRDIMIDYRQMSDGGVVIPRRNLDHDSRDVLRDAIFESRPRKGGREGVGVGSAKFEALHLGRARASAALHDALQHERREFTLDIDLDDYDKDGGVRFCACRGKKQVCAQCWLFAEAASAIIEYTTAMYLGHPPAENDEQFMWTFSGRKGLHAWYSHACWDDLDTKARAYLAQYLTFVPSTETNIQPGERRYVEYIYAFFLQRISCPARRVLGDPATRQWLLAFIHKHGGRACTQALAPVLNAWSRLAIQTLPPESPDVFMIAWKKHMPNPPFALKLCIAHDLLRPRLDDGALGRSHLLKAPFSINHTTLALDLPLENVLIPDAQLPVVTVIDLEAHAGDNAARSFRLLLDGQARFLRWLRTRYPQLAEKYPSSDASDDFSSDDLSSTLEMPM